MPPLRQTEIRPYKIAVDEDAVKDLSERLARARLPDELDGDGKEWELGTPLKDMQQILDYWKNTFDWRAAEEKLNQFPQFETSIAVDGFDPLDIHFIHQRCTYSENAIPLIFVHGWPGSFYEGTKIIHPLTEGGPGVPGFHVVVPSLPNFGFSQGPNKKGFSIQQHAEALHKLMLRLGYTEYATQGGDWGYFITRVMSMKYPNHVKATHLNLDHGSPPKFSQTPLLAIEHSLKPYTAAEKQGFARMAWFKDAGSGYSAIQSTKPQTVGYALRDSPTALLGWIYEKLHDWTDNYPWTHEELCTWISIYWFSTAGPQASVRLYWEFKQNNAPGAAAERAAFSQQNIAAPLSDGRVKIGLSHFPKDVIVMPSVWTRTQGDVVFEKSHPDGGHFPAWERPEAIVGDLREMFGRGGGAAKLFKKTKL